ncbi:predicted protein [Chaetomium globosum CBS 148.51]|uniref:Uncharacterized protein n=1 Tax=Chaetomium globosum (strain ATCC 6205 / CBS 148.51 / DSM 1962 / NBRC 6347 / NRRL 1970) TaxID=306901 RepID=Q2HDH7_CHAGB|nr:uncharacterized protein CHGG_01727 [Chaetomium globosum CBS 148.51]EAQ93492.1 predicted protein [Chaetomium globosum CBS 148.51]
MYIITFLVIPKRPAAAIFAARWSPYKVGCRRTVWSSVPLALSVLDNLSTLKYLDTEFGLYCNDLRG